MRVNEHVIEGWKDNILKVYGLAAEEEVEEGKVWYLEARKFCERAAFQHYYYVGATESSYLAGALAALSPCLPWEANKAALLELLIEGTAYRQSEANVFKAKRILAGEDPLCVLGGLKVRAFYTCIVDSGASQVCVDRHAKSICFGCHLSEKELKQWEGDYYYDFENAYQRAAKELGITGYQLQASTWLAWRRLKREWGKCPVKFNLIGYEQRDYENSLLPKPTP